MAGRRLRHGGDVVGEIALDQGGTADRVDGDQPFPRTARPVDGHQEVQRPAVRCEGGRAERGGGALPVRGTSSVPRP